MSKNQIRKVVSKLGGTELLTKWGKVKVKRLTIDQYYVLLDKEEFLFPVSLDEFEDILKDNHLI